MKHTDLNSRKKLAEERVYRRFYLYFHEDVIGNFFLESRKRLKSSKNQAEFAKTLQQYRSDLKKLLIIRNIPEHWYITFSKIIEQGKIDLPVHESIFLSVGDNTIINEGFDKIRIKSEGSKKLSIQIAAKVTKNQIRDFVDLNSDLIGKVIFTLDLFELKTPRMDNFGEGIMTYLNTEGRKITINKLLKEESLEESLNEDETDRIEKMHRDYKKRLSPNK